jgi:hypothetical protein
LADGAGERAEHDNNDDDEFLESDLDRRIGFLDFGKAYFSEHRTSGTEGPFRAACGWAG